MEKIFDQSQITDILVKRNQTHFGQTRHTVHCFSAQKTG
jgi:hypothetical protein